MRRPQLAARARQAEAAETDHVEAGTGAGLVVAPPIVTPAPTAAPVAPPDGAPAGANIDNGIL